MKRNGFLKHIDFLVIDIVMLTISFFAALFIRKVEYLNGRTIYAQLFIYEYLSMIFVIYIYSPYSGILKKNKISIAYEHIVFSVLQLVVVSLLLFIGKTGVYVSRLFIAIEYVVFAGLGLLPKLLLVNKLKKQINNSIKYNNNNNNKVLVVTNDENIDNVIKKITNKNFELYNLVGVCVLDKEYAENEYKGCKIACKKNNLISYICGNQIDCIYFESLYKDIPEEMLNEISKTGITTYFSFENIKVFPNQEQKIENIFGEYVISNSLKQRTDKQIFRKKLMDLIGGIIGSAITILLTIIIGPLIKIASPKGPIFYKQERIGLNGRHFYMYKFRTMIPNAESQLDRLIEKNNVTSNLMFKMKNDPRIIPGIGHFLRKTSLDEFPQFFNILKGDMSLVGTRPPTVDEWKKYGTKYRARMAIKPGITGLWQVSGRNSITDFDEVYKLDMKYINEWRISLDIRIIFKTIVVLFDRKNNEAY